MLPNAVSLLIGVTTLGRLPLSRPMLSFSPLALASLNTLPVAVSAVSSVTSLALSKATGKLSVITMSKLSSELTPFLSVTTTS